MGGPGRWGWWSPGWTLVALAAGIGGGVVAIAAVWLPNAMAVAVGAGIPVDLPMLVWP